MAKKEKFDYFEALEKQAKLAVREADLLIETVEKFEDADSLVAAMKAAHELEHSGDEINHAIFRRVASDFVTPIEREDIIELSQSLDSLTDGIESVIRRFYMYDVHFMHHDALEFACLIKKSCEALVDAMEDFRNFKKSKNFKNLIVEVNSCEEEADHLYMNVIHKLYTHDRENPMRVLVWSQIFDRMEECCDACETVADAMDTVMLKNA